MKKSIVSLVIFFAIHGCNAMGLGKLSTYENEKCCRVARYLDKYPEGKSEDEKNKIDIFFSSKKTTDKKNKKFLLCIEDYRNKIKNKKSFLMVAVCKELPFDTQKLIFDIMHQSIKGCFINKTITAFEQSFQAETRYSAANINLAKDFKSRMRDDLLKLLQEPMDKKLTLTCSLYVDCPQFNPIQAINCTHVINFFNKTEHEYQKLLDMLVKVKEDADIVKLYIQFMTYLASDKFLRSISCQKSLNKMNIGKIYNMVTNL
ncbi:MAG TPA: hypothetical protein VKU36_02055 [Candidatus Babeliales bacterium]|nr:hypothetical protein [Candidatus Babeliales bacterium]